MMALPVQSIRARPEHRDLLQSVAELLRSGGEPTLRKLLTHANEQPVGPFRSESAAVAFLRDRLVVALKPRAIWLFGSRARGDARADSDFDLLVVLPDGLPGEAYDFQRVAEPVVACGLAYDIVPCSWGEFQKEQNESGTLVNKAVTEGRPIYTDRALRARRRTTT
jgi:nucleotidyltransferase-like protein